MTNFLKNIWTTLTTTTGDNDMARIDDANNLFANGKFIGSYSRRRDAVRGAKRRGFYVKP